MILFPSKIQSITLGLFITGLLGCNPGPDDALDATSPTPTATVNGVVQGYHIIETPTPDDRDGDGFSRHEDCDDNAVDIYPAAPEACNGLDDNCDGLVDENPTLGATLYFPDEDGDGYGDRDGGIYSCTPLLNHVTIGGDCSDDMASIHPEADEYCDGYDNNCDGRTDNDALDMSTWYFDNDADGFGDEGQSTLHCLAPYQYVGAAGDCDDDNAQIHPEAIEACNMLVDYDCDGLKGNGENCHGQP